MNERAFETEITFGKYDTAWLRSRYLKEFNSQSEAEGTHKASVAIAKGLSLSIKRIGEAEALSVGGVNFQVFHDYCLIDVLWLDPNFRGQGMGRLMYEEVERHAKSLGQSRVLLSAFENQGNLSFWLAMGFEEVGRVKDYPIGQQLVYLHKKLD